eukprot:10803023-Lingulodinium_polyedra.AAC.1
MRQAYGARVAALPLSRLAGLPARAAVVDTAEVSRGYSEELAAQREDPDWVLRPRAEWPLAPVR